MAAVLRSCLTWLQRHVTWSNSRQSWQERIGGALLLAGAAAIWWCGSRLTLTQHVVLWGLLFLAFAALLRRGWLKLFGPVLFYDLIRIARRRRYILLRTLYAAGLLLLLSWIYFLSTFDMSYGNQTTIQKQAELADQFFFTLMSVQFLVVVVLTPAYTAGAIADEKDRKTLEFLLATDLRNREIVLSKLAARLANMTLIILTGLPILSLVQFFGGIDPDLLLAGFATLGLTMLSLAGLSILNSVYARKPRDAIVITYLGAAVYVALGLLSLLLLQYPLAANFPSTSFWTSPITVTDLVGWFNSGNLLIALGELTGAWSGGKPLADILPKLLRDYALFHGLVAGICSGWAVARLRAVALKQTYGKAHKLSLGTRWLGRPRVGMHPMLWKEIFAEPGLRFHWMGRIIFAILILVSFVPAAWILIDFALEMFGPTGGGNRWRTPLDELHQNMNIWVRTVGTIVACLTLLAVAVRAAGAISGERDRQTFDGLLTTPLDSSVILFAKWLGSILSVRWSWLWLGLIWVLGIITGGMHILALPLVVAAWAVYAAVFASIGLWFSMVSRTTLRATIWTMLTTVGISVGHWLVTSMCCFMPLAVMRVGSVGNDFMEYALKFEFGQTPPLVLGLLAFQGQEFEPKNSYQLKEILEMTGFSLLGIFSWAIAAGVLWGVTSARFRTVTGRQPFRRPERSRLPGQRRPPASSLQEVQGPDNPPGAIWVAEEGENRPTPVEPKSSEGPAF